MVTCASSDSLGMTSIEARAGATGAPAPAAVAAATLRPAAKRSFITWTALAMMITGSVASLRSAPTMAVFGLASVFLYVGPAIVFEAPWDLKGALWVRYRDTTIRADVVSPNLRVEPDAIVTRIYGEDSRYPYQGLIVFNARLGSTYPLADAESARAYLAQHNPDLSSGCPPGRPGHGVQVF